MTKRIRRHIKDARFEDEREFDNRLVTLPTIKITFDDNRTRKSGKVFINNTIKFDKKLEAMRIDSALKGYVSERKYLSKDRDWYIYEFYSVDSHKQLKIKSASDLIDRKRYEEEFNLLVLLALETGMRRGELLAIRPESLYEYGIKARHSISPTSDDTSLKTQNVKRCFY
ncbi:hypothetical protein [Salinibacillus kushneri]|nr:hypothetical protein [Salinibacillus kushneri]